MTFRKSSMVVSHYGGCLSITVIPIIVMGMPSSSFAAQAFNPHTGRPDFCMTVREIGDSPAVTSCTTVLEVSNGTLTDSGSGVFTLTTGGGGGNSFETISVPAGTNPVADSSTDTLTITETSFLTITGTAASDTIDITQ